MKCILYASEHGHTKKIADELNKELNLDTFDVKNSPDVEKYNLIIILCPTYGDEELPIHMEDYLIKLNTKKKKFILCELGNYYGYENYTFGAGKIIKYLLENLGWIELMPFFSLDSLPKINWNAFEIWKKKVTRLITNV